jgi:hypothetical protein
MPFSRGDGECARGKRTGGAARALRVIQRRGQILEAAVHSIDHPPPSAVVACRLAGLDCLGRRLLQRDRRQAQLADRLLQASQYGRHRARRLGSVGRAANRGSRFDEIAGEVVELVVGLTDRRGTDDGTHDVTLHHRVGARHEVERADDLLGARMPGIRLGRSPHGVAEEPKLGWSTHRRTGLRAAILLDMTDD